MSENFTQTDQNALRAPHVNRAWFLDIDYNGEPLRLHSGVGTFRINGVDWSGVSDPFSSPTTGRIASIGQVEEPRFGAAVAIPITLSGADRNFLRSIDERYKNLEGRTAKLYFATFDAETEGIIIPLRTVFVGFLSSPEIQWQAGGVRTVSITIESQWSGQNYAFVSTWSSTGQKRRFPGDLGFDLVGVDTAESYR